MNYKFRKKTFELRKTLVKKLTKTLLPKTSKGIDAYYWDTIEKVNKVPRPFTKFLKEVMGSKKHLRGCEIGFGFGYNAANLLEELNIETLYCVDPYINKTYVEGGLFVDGYKEAFQLESLFPKLSKDKRVIFIQLDSIQAFTKNFSLRNLDFVYVDGNHTFYNAYADLVNSFHALRPKGYVGGHDFTLLYPTVVDAAVKFAVDFQLVPTIKTPDFWFRKL